MTTMLVRATGSGRLGTMMSIAMLPVVVVPVFGPVIGGLLVGLDWRWIFFVNVPVCLGAIWLARRHVPHEAPTDPGQRLDVVGLLLLADPDLP